MLALADCIDIWHAGALWVTGGRIATIHLRSNPRRWAAPKFSVFTPRLRIVQFC